MEKEIKKTTLKLNQEAEARSKKEKDIMTQNFNKQENKLKDKLMDQIKDTEKQLNQKLK